MELTHRHLAPIFESILQLLAPTPELMEQFELWAIQQSQMLQRAAEESKSSLTYEADLMREELFRLSGADPESMHTEPTARMRMCQKMWLTGLLDFVDDLLDQAESAAASWAA